MSNSNDIPASATEQVRMIEGILIAAATDGAKDTGTYQVLRQILIRDEEVNDLLPRFVRIYRDLSVFWPFIKRYRACCRMSLN